MLLMGRPMIITMHRQLNFVFIREIDDSKNTDPVLIINSAAQCSSDTVDLFVDCRDRGSILF